MRDELLEYYQTELGALRTMGAAFAKRYPKLARRLELDPKESTDPHVERLLQGFAFLAARVQLKIDDDFPEISEALLNVVYPHYLRPIPAMTIVQFDLDPEKAKLPSGYPLEAGREMLSRLEIRGEDPNNPSRNADTLATRCKFRTCYPTTVWPLRVESAEWMSAAKLNLSSRATGAVNALKIRLKCFADSSFSTMTLDSLRVYIDGADHLPYTLYELLTNNCIGILIRDPARQSAPLVELPASAIRPVGFAEDEGALPYVRRSFLGYRLLQEYFAFPQKFLFFDLTGLAALRGAGFGTDAEVSFLFSGSERPKRTERFETEVQAGTFRLGCTPAINLFDVYTEPCRLDQRSSAYHLIADDYHLRTTHIFSVDSVTLRSLGVNLAVEPLYSLGRRPGAEAKAYWVARRKPSVSRRDDPGGEGARRPDDPSGTAAEDYVGATELWLSFIDLTGRVTRPEADTFDAKVTCFNGQLRNRLPIGSGGGQTNDFDLPGDGPFRRITALVSPSQTALPPLGKSQLWRLISLLSLNYVSITEGGPEALRAMLRLHDTGDSPNWTGRDHINGLVDIRSTPHYTRIVREDGAGFARGRRIELDFDEDKFEGAGVYLFASVLEQFLGSYVSLNSFSVVTASSKQRGLLREWPPRAGWQSAL